MKVHPSALKHGIFAKTPSRQQSGRRGSSRSTTTALPIASCASGSTPGPACWRRWSLSWRAARNWSFTRCPPARSTSTCCLDDRQRRAVTFPIRPPAPPDHAAEGSVWCSARCHYPLRGRGMAAAARAVLRRSLKGHGVAPNLWCIPGWGGVTGTVGGWEITERTGGGIGFALRS